MGQNIFPFKPTTIVKPDESSTDDEGENCDVPMPKRQVKKSFINTSGLDV